jgi:hypothetical protein
MLHDLRLVFIVKKSLGVDYPLLRDMPRSIPIRLGKQAVIKMTVVTVGKETTVLAIGKPRQSGEARCSFRFF